MSGALFDTVMLHAPYTMIPECKAVAPGYVFSLSAQRRVEQGTAAYACWHHSSVASTRPERMCDTCRG
jgi:hypothetical protein